MRRLAIALVVMLVFTPACQAQSTELSCDLHHTVVLCEATDAFRPLAQEIAATEGLPLLDDWPDALAVKPWTILWVAAPDTLTEKRFARAGMLLREHGPVSLGIISGSTLDGARALWQRQPATDGALVSIVPREGTIEAHRDGNPVDSEAVSLEGAVVALSRALVVSYQGHGTRSYWHLSSGSPEEEVRLERAHLPEMDGTVVVAGACQTLKIWSQDSIALAFADNGASAYCGYLHSPQGYAFGEPKGFAEARTWPEFPLGMLVAVQNRGLGQGHLAWPYYLLLGDPRQALTDGPSYAIDSDQAQGDRRVIELSELPAGPVPVLVEDGAEYSYVRVEGDGHAYRGDPFYDADVQMIDVGPTKYLLVDSSGGKMRLILQRETPAWVRIIEPLGDALDHTTLIHHTQGSLVPNLVLAASVWLAVAWRRLRTKVRLGNNLIRSALVGLSLTGARGGYAWYRASYLRHMYGGYLRTMDVTWNISVPFLVSSLALTVGATWLLLNARRWWGKLVAAPLVMAPTSVMAGFWMAFSTGLNVLARQQYGAPLYGHTQGITALSAYAVEALLVTVVLAVASKLRA